MEADLFHADRQKDGWTVGQTDREAGRSYYSLFVILRPRLKIILNLFKDTVRTPLSVLVTKTDRLVLYRKINAVCS